MVFPAGHPVLLAQTAAYPGLSCVTEVCKEDTEALKAHHH